MKHGIVFVCAWLALGSGLAAAQPAVDAEKCRGITGNPDLAIKHCTAAINSGKFSGRPLAEIYFSRAVEWTNKGEIERAIADYDAAIRVDPKYAEAYHNRGLLRAAKGESDRAIADYDAALRLDDKDTDVYLSRAIEWAIRGDYARAIADYDAVLRLQPLSAPALFGRGRALFYMGDFAAAVEALERAHQARATDYTGIWLYLARKRHGDRNAEALLERDTRATRDGSWPAVVLALYVGQATVENVLKAPVEPDPAAQRTRRCEAHFYIAQWHLLRGETDAARSLLQEARRACPRDEIEYEGTVAELRRIAK
jgi:lipoprotein NlpI